MIKYVAHVAFCQQIVILGTSKRQDQFLAVDGWLIHSNEFGVTLEHPGAQNFPPVPAFGVVGIGYCISGPVEANDGEGRDDSPSSDSGPAQAEPAPVAVEGDGGGVDAGGAPVAAEQAEGEAQGTPLTEVEAGKIAARVFGKGRRRGR